ncbi:UBA domain-containing protein 3 [Colletotrichum sp. SAR 10_99]|nr:UBA domain-containing protein 3 [Colletotrichum sp. SAR 10_96]KAJ5012182.1 UBA domain-containing protein 3 [Colletotrichum sp. SAR 10_99]
MTGVLSKRQQARNEKVLHDLVQTVPGNNFCADCQARNPAWASWSLGVFLCMRCAAIHRKLGTHISKVKSLSMDSWSNEQVENMKKVGNVRSNGIYNPDNKKPPVPVDADEADSAMERFIRSKYMNNNPAPARKQHSGLSDEGVPPPLPPKAGGKFGFRSASSIFPLSSRSKKEAAMRNASNPRDMPRSPSPSELPNKPSKVFGLSVQYEQEDTERKLASLRDMGFPDNQRNAAVLKGVNGNLERAIETLVRLGETDRRSPSLTGPRESSLRATRSHANLSSTSSGLSAPQQTFSDHPQSPSTASSNNPFDLLPPQPQSSQSTGTLANKNPYANNPFGAPSQTQQDFNQAFSNMSLAPAQPLFPHHTGGLPASQPPFAQPQQQTYQQSMTPPAPQAQQNYSHINFNSNMTYPQPQPIQPQSTGYNPFFTNQTQPAPQQSLAVNTTGAFANNPFARSPTRIQSPSLGQIPEQTQSNFYTTSPRPLSPQNTNPFFSQMASQATGQQQMPTPQQHQQPFQQQSFQSQPFQSQPFQQQALQSSPFQQQSPWQQQPPQQPQVQQQEVPQQQQQQQQQHQWPGQDFSQQQQVQAPAQQPLYQQPQQPQRPDKASILALYNMPQLAPQPFQQQPQEPAQAENAVAAQAGQEANGPAAGTKNPFLSNGPTSPVMTQKDVGPRRTGVSRESMAFTDMQWTNGRHSPDAFASLSARHIRELTHSTNVMASPEFHARLRGALPDDDQAATLPPATALSTASKSLPRPGGAGYLAPLGTEATLAHILDEIVPGLNGQARSGRYYGFVTGGTLPVAEAADNIVTAFDQNVQVHLPGQTVATELESVALRMLADVLALEQPGSEEVWKGRTFTTGATASNVLGLACGREAVVTRRGGNLGSMWMEVTYPQPLSDVWKAMLMGEAFGIFARALDGSPEFAKIKDMAAGLELADSITVDGHKLLNVPYDCGMFFTRSLETLASVFTNPNAAYLSSGPSSIPSPLNVGLENSRRFRALPAYAVLRSEGRQGLAAILGRMVLLARKIASWIRESEAYELLPEGDWSVEDTTHMVVLFRAKDENVSEELVGRINGTREMYVSGTSWKGKKAVRVAVGSWRVDVERDFEVVKRVLEQVKG